MIMVRKLLIGIILVGLVLAALTEEKWILIAIAAIVITGAVFIRWENIRIERRALYKVKDKRNSFIAMSLLLLAYAIYLGHSLYMMKNDDQFYFLFLTFSYLLYIPISGSYEEKFLFNERDILYKGNRVPYSQISRINEESRFFVLSYEASKDIKIQKKLIGDDLMTFINRNVKSTSVY